VARASGNRAGWMELNVQMLKTDLVKKNIVLKNLELVLSGSSVLLVVEKRGTVVDFLKSFFSHFFVKI